MISSEHLKGIVAFVQAAEAGGFTPAAQRTGLTKSGIAKGVSRLEERLGVRLFNRTTRRFALTTEGQTFYEACLRLLSEFEDAETALTAPLSQPRGRLRVDLPVVFGRRWVLPVLLDIASRYPELAIETVLTDRSTDLIEESVDIAVRIGDLSDSATLIARQLGVQQSMLCAAPDYVVHNGQPNTLSELAGHSCIVRTHAGQALPWWFIDNASKPFAHPITGRLSFNDAEATSEAALAGQGIALLSSWLVADHVRGGRLVQILPDVATRGFPIHAVWPRARQPSLKVRVVIDALVGRFLPEPPWNQR